ncbi:MAG: hypothetical protein COV67_07585 [Nitrospinae bacterium CG11_big_fil_rev_8_21_14_0_20_56_8]|nr:MAG: hypothetical protein COV67_07585 [Nitrospinae bacterium CG11_big_fil_rev_8_21_14_0_20_56_8]
MKIFGNAVIVSILSMGVIFLVLSVLICTIKILVHFMPYQAPAAPPAFSPARSTPGGGAGAPGGSAVGEHIAAITGALSAHLGKNPDQIHISSVKPV